MNPPFGVFNVTTQTWVKNGNYHDFTTLDYFEARIKMESLEGLGYEFEIRERPDFKCADSVPF